jgi:hypothetical protein
VQRVVDPVEIVEESCHRRNLDDLTVIVVFSKPAEESIVDPMRIECQLLRVRQRRPLCFRERPVLEIEQ